MGWNLRSGFSPLFTDVTFTAIHVNQVLSIPQFVAYFEIGKKLNETQEEVYEILKLHFEDFFGGDWKATKYEQCFDEHQKMYRFEASSQGIMLLTSNPNTYKRKTKGR